MTRRLPAWSAVPVLLFLAGRGPADPPKDGLPPGAVSRVGNTSLRHAAPPTCVAFSPDGKFLVSGGQDGAVRVWDLATGHQTAVAHRPNSPVAGVLFTHRGARLAANFPDGIRFLDPTTLDEVATHPNPATSHFDVSPDGSLIAVVDRSMYAEVAELDTGLPKLKLPDGPLVAFHPDGRRVAAADHTGVVTVYRATGGKPEFRVAHGEPVRGLAVRPDGAAFATVGTPATGVVKVWQVGDPEPVAVLKEATAPIAFVGNDRLAAVYKHGVGVYDLKRKAWVHHVPEATGAFAVSPDGTKLAATGTGGLRVRVWDLTTGKQLHAAADELPDVALVIPSADSRSVTILGGKQTFRWPLGGRRLIPGADLPGAVTAAAFSGGSGPTGRGVLVAALPGGLGVWDGFSPSAALPAPSRTVPKLGEVLTVAVSADGKRAACGGDDQSVRLIDPAAGKVLRALPVKATTLGLAFTPAGDRLAILGRDGWLRLWHVIEGEPIPGEAGDLELWKFRIAVDRQTQTPRGTLAVSSDGRLIAASASARVSVVDANSGREVFAIDRHADDGLFQAAAFSPDGRLLITGSGGTTGSVRVWEVGTRGLVRRYSAGLGGVNRLAVFPDGSRVASAGADDAVTVWDLTFRAGRPQPADSDLNAAWAALVSPDAGTGYPAAQVLAAGGPRAVPVVREGLREVVATHQRVKRLIADLGSEDPDTREAASKELPKLGVRAWPLVLEAAGSASPEVQRRAAEVADALTRDNGPPPNHGLVGDVLRLYRVVPVLEAVGGDEAKALLGQVADLGGPAADEAKAALRRLDRRR